MARTKLTVPAYFDALDSRQVIAYLESVAASAVSEEDTEELIPSYTARGANMVGDGVTDDGPALANFLDGLKLTGGGRLELFSPTQNDLIATSLAEPADPNTYSFFINSSVDIPSNTHIVWNSPVLLGPAGRFRMFGNTREVDRGVDGQGRIAETALAGSITLKLDTAHPNSQVSQYPVGTFLLMRGENDINGAAINSPDRVVVIAVDEGTGVLTFDPALNADYDPTYPDSAFEAPGLDSTDRTTVGIITSSLLATSATVSDASLQLVSGGASKFMDGDFILVQDQELVTDFIDDLQPANPNVTPSANPIKRELMRIINVNTSTDVIDLDRGVTYAYDISETASIQLVDAVSNSSMLDAKIKFKFETEPTDRNHHPIEMAYAHNCLADHCIIDARYDTGELIGGKSQGIRTFISSQCAVRACAVINPQFTSSGEGYGATLYASHGCTITDFYATGCRHSILLQGASQNIIENIISVDALISDIDFHGIFEMSNLVNGVICISGSRQSEDLDDTKTAIRLGNTFHLAGCHQNTVQNVNIYNFNDAKFTSRAIQILPTSSNNVIRNVTGYDCEYGIFINDLARGTPSMLTSDDNIIEDCTFYDTAEYAVSIDNSANGSIIPNTQGITLRNIRDIRSGKGLRVIQADRVIIENYTNQDSVGAVSHAMTLTNITNLKVLNPYLLNADRGLDITNCPSFLVKGATFDSITSSTVFTDGGGNTDYNWLDCDYPNTPAAQFNNLTSTRDEERHSKQFREEVVAGYTDSGTTISTQIPLDDTSPTISEGDEIATTTLTPGNPTGKLIIEGHVPFVSTDTETNVTVTLFNGSIIIGVQSLYLPATFGSGMVVTGSFDLTSTASKTISMRIGPSTGSTNLTVGGKFSTEGHPYIRILEVNR